MTAPHAAEYVKAFATGMAERIAEAGIGAWKTDGPYADTDVGTVIAARPPESPPQLIVLSPYVLQDHPEAGDSLFAVHVLCRGDQDVRTVLDRDGAIFDLFHGLRGAVVGGVYVVTMWRQTTAPLVPDRNQRQESSSTFYARVNWPTRYRPD